MSSAPGGPAEPEPDQEREAQGVARRIARTRAQDVARRVHGKPPPPVTGPRYAGLVTRVIAFVVDAAIINGVAAIVAAAAALVLALFPLGHQARTVIAAIGAAVFVVWMVGYFATFWATTGQTPGNRVMHVQVMRASGARLKPRVALLRVGGLVLAALPLFLGFAPILLTDRRRGLADWIADTVVVRTEDSPT